MCSYNIKTKPKPIRKPTDYDCDHDKIDLESHHDLHIGEIETRQVSKRELIDLIQKNFRGVNENNSICVIVNTKMSNGENNQTIMFGKSLEW